MTDGEQYTPGPASGSQVRKDREIEEDHLHGRAPADMLERFPGVRSLCG
jgi:hypothetical protein